MKTWFWFGCTWIALLAAAGCGGTDGPVTYPISGSVTLDGRPLETGEVLFRSEGDVATFAGQISAGKYSLSATAGKKRVEITSTQIVPGAQGERGGTLGDPISESNTAHVYKEAVPAKYNKESTLTAEVIPSGPHQIDFALTTSGK